MRTDDSEAGEGKVERAIGLYVLRSVNILIGLVCAVGILWIKANVPSKRDFESFQAQVRSIEMNVIQLRQTDARITDFENRIRELERKGRLIR